MSRTTLPTLFNDLEDLHCLVDNLGFNSPHVHTRQEASDVSIYEDDTAIFVEAALPGVKPENVELTFEKGILWIKGEVDHEREDIKYHRKSTKSFTYKVCVPGKVDEQANPEAVSKHGIITIRFAKSRASQPRKIEVKLA